MASPQMDFDPKVGVRIDRLTGEDAPKRLETPAMPNLQWRMSPSIGKLVEALAKAQLEFDPVLKDSDNPAFRSKYADLATVIDATRPHLAAQGLSIIQMPHAKFGTDDAKEMILTTLMAHSSGEWIATDLSLPAMMRERFDAQAVGSAITYARRYALAAITGVAQEDDDGNKAAGVGSKDAAQTVAKTKLKEMAHEPVTIVPWKEGTLALAGNGLAIVRNEMTEDDKTKVNVKWNASDRVWSIPEPQGNLFASLAEKYGVKVVWKD